MQQGHREVWTREPRSIFSERSQLNLERAVQAAMADPLGR